MDRPLARFADSKIALAFLMLDKAHPGLESGIAAVLYLPEVLAAPDASAARSADDLPPRICSGTPDHRVTNEINKLRGSLTGKNDKTPPFFANYGRISEKCTS